MDDIESHRPQRDPDGVSCVPEDRKIRWSRGPGSHHRICEFRGVPGNRVQGGGPCLRDRLQDLYDRGTRDIVWNILQLGGRGDLLAGEHYVTGYCRRLWKFFLCFIGLKKYTRKLLSYEYIFLKNYFRQKGRGRRSLLLLPGLFGYNDRKYAIYWRKQDKR